ncbi:PUA domain-containing protein [Methanobrevibacter sp. UBA46]
MKDDEVVGVGKAVLNGVEMEKSNSGMAVKIRHRKK